MKATKTEDDKPQTLSARLAAIAHEVTTPIAVAQAAAAALAEEAARVADPVLGEAMRANAALVLRNLERASKLLGAYKRTAADEARGGGARLRFSLAGTVRDAVETLAPALKRAGVQAVVRTAPEGDPLDTVGDPGAVAQVVVNLVLNAVQHAYREKGFAGAGRVEIDLRRPPSGEFVLEVRDRGRGIPADLLPRIFEAGFTTDRAGGGTGMGLAVVRELAEERLGGGVRCESEAGKGTLFAVRIAGG